MASDKNEELIINKVAFLPFAYFLRFLLVPFKFRRSPITFAGCSQSEFTLYTQLHFTIAFCAFVEEERLSGKCTRKAGDGCTRMWGARHCHVFENC